MIHFRVDPSSRPNQKHHGSPQNYVQLFHELFHAASYLADNGFSLLAIAGTTDEAGPGRRAQNEM